MSKNKQRSMGVFISYMAMCANFIIGLVYTPFLIKCLGQSEYGNYNYVYSIANYLTLFTCGFGSAYLRFTMSYRKSKNKEEIERINGLFFLLFLFMGIIALVIGGIMTCQSEWILAGKLTNEELLTGKILMGILVVNVFTTFPVSVFNSYVISQEEFIFQKSVVLIRTFMGPALGAIILSWGGKSIGIAIVTLLVSMIIDSIIIFFCIFKLKMRFRFDNLKLAKAKEIFVFSSFLLLSMIVDQINWSVDKFLLGKICGTVAVAVYTVGATINVYYMSIGEAISNVFVPQVYKLLSDKQGDRKASILMTRLGRIQFMILSLIITGFILFGKCFIELWIGKDYLEAYLVILLLIIPVTVPEIQKIGLEIQKAKNLHKFRSLVYTFIAGINIIITIPLIMKIGIIGSAFGTAVTVLLGNGIIMNIYYQKVVKIDVLLFWKEICKIIPAVFLSFACGYIVKMVVSPNNWLLFGFSIIVYTILYVIIIYVLGMNKNEKQQLVTFFIKP